MIRMKMDTDIDNLTREIDACQRCSASKIPFTKVSGIFRGCGSEKILLIGEAPSRQSADQKIAFHGQSFQRLHCWFKEAGFSGDERMLRSKLYLTSLVKCIESNDRYFSSMFLNCRNFLFRQIEAIKPEVVVALGRKPASYLCPMFGIDWHMEFGEMISSNEIYSRMLFPPTENKFDFLLLPHPSGLSRTMNDDEVKKRVIFSISKNLIYRI